MANPADDSLAQNVPDLYLDPVTLSFTEPDYSRLDKPVRPPPPPQVWSLYLTLYLYFPQAASPAFGLTNGQNGHMSVSSDADPFR